MGIMAISEDPDEMPQNAAFHLGLHCLVIQKQSPRKTINGYYTMDQPGCIVPNFMENSIGQKWVNIFKTEFLKLKPLTRYINKQCRNRSYAQ